MAGHRVSLCTNLVELARSQPVGVCVRLQNGGVRPARVFIYHKQLERQHQVGLR